MRFALFRRTAPDPAHLEIAYAGRVFQVALRRRPAARRITLRVSSATGEVVLTLPEHVEIAAAKRFADSHGGWIASRLERVPQRVGFIHDAVVPLRGTPHRIVHWSTVRGPTVATDAHDGESVIGVSGDATQVPRRVREFLDR